MGCQPVHQGQGITGVGSRRPDRGHPPAWQDGPCGPDYTVSVPNMLKGTAGSTCSGGPQVPAPPSCRRVPSTSSFLLSFCLLFSSSLLFLQVSNGGAV